MRYPVNMKQTTRHSILALFCGIICSLAILLSSCRNDRPAGIPSPSHLEQVLYDYHLAQALAQSERDSLYPVAYYTEAALAKYGMSEQDFARTMGYYTRHADELQVVYEQVRERFASSYDVKRGSLDASELQGDTLNLWPGKETYLLMANGVNRLQQTFEPDTLLRNTDRIVWQFNTFWYYHEGAKNAIAQLAVIYDNDSVATTTRMVYSTGLQELSISIGTPSVRRICCMLYQVSPWTQRPRFLAVLTPALIRVRTGTQPMAAAMQHDSLNHEEPSVEQRLQDSLLRQDTLRSESPHRTIESPISRGFRGH